MTSAALSLSVDARPAPNLLPPGRERRRLHVVPDAQSVLAVDFQGGGHDPEFGPQHARSSDLPDPAAWSTRLVLALMDVMNGLRPPAQVERALVLDLRERVRRAHAVAQRRGARPTRPSRVLRVRVCENADGVAEVSAVVHDRGRVRAIAMRLSGVDGRWLVTVLQIG
ncbi:Rv3235 family protein [Calidifontibacter indicus]|uniref:Alanine, arginine and proline rich protein n=1 Tax=Calidifontibacter indicus TaxID=419650 RepID=A0A3D9UX30_9MICO|nr:Rv3235 family protein [Calidifontibacter indicus]REF30534.1 hypothetical protein DFJ65_1545 [Calidifontibacter indicus]